jgi:6-methylsalicylate decarboxylase
MEGHHMIDVHAHFTTPSYIEAAKSSGHREADGMPEWYWPEWNPQTHLELMDRAGIEKSYLSMSSPGVHFGDDSAARALAREVNDAGATVKRDYPQRFGLFASLPLPDIDGALVELSRAYDELDADGVIVLTNSQGLYLGNPALSPVFEEINRRSGVIFIHPTSAKGTELVDCGRPRPMIEFLFETARTVVDYLLSGNADGYPNVRVIVPHCSGVIPLLVDRIQLFAALNPESEAEPVIAKLRRFFFDLAGIPSALQISALREVCPHEHLLYGSDYPWTSSDLAMKLLDNLDNVLEPDWRIATHKNAESLFKPSAH